MKFLKANIPHRLLPYLMAMVLTMSASLHVSSEPLMDIKTDAEEEPISSTETVSVAPATISVVQVVLEVDFPLLQTIEISEETSSKHFHIEGLSGKVLKYSRVLFRLIISPNAP